MTLNQNQKFSRILNQNQKQKQKISRNMSRNLSRNLSRIGFFVILSCLLVGCNTAQDTASLERSPEIQSLTDSINVALGGNDYYGASQIVERFVINHPDAFEAWEIRGRIYRDANQFEKARQSFETAAELRPGDIGVWHELGNIAVTEQRYQDAVTAFRHAASDASGPLPWHGLGRGPERKD